MNIKPNFAKELRKFISQAKTNNLKTKEYIKEYEKLHVKVSFGQGAQANIPWISFLADGHTTSNGIYPVYLYYKSLNLLILAYGISETNQPNIKWQFDSIQTINEFFIKNNFIKPERYGSSFLYKSYLANNLPNDDELNFDLAQITKEYKDQILYKNYEPHVMITKFENESFNIKKFQANLQKSNLIFSESFITRFIASLTAKPFLLLSGLAGSGKTKLAQSFAMWICHSSEQYKIVSVGADWTNREPLLGFPNALDSMQYLKPEHGVLELIIESAKPENSLNPYFLILDEMNLSHVERYFADFLSAMESGEYISLHSSKEEISGVPSRLLLPANLFIIGTVNIDETTYMFSPKVLDRANVIEFRVTHKDLAGFLDNPQRAKISSLSGAGAAMAESFVAISQETALNQDDEENKALKEKLLRFFAELHKISAEFGYRTTAEIFQLISKLSKLDSTLTLNEKLDIAIMQKLLPKLHGSRRKLEPVLNKLMLLCLGDDEHINSISLEQIYKDGNLPAKTIYKLSLDKIIRMYRNCIDNGFASYAEA